MTTPRNIFSNLSDSLAKKNDVSSNFDDASPLKHVQILKASSNFNYLNDMSGNSDDIPSSNGTPSTFFFEYCTDSSLTNLKHCRYQYILLLDVHKQSTALQVNHKPMIRKCKSHFKWASYDHHPFLKILHNKCQRKLILS